MVSPFFRAVIWFVLNVCVGCMNDILSKFLVSDYHFIEITFFRFFFSAVTLLPFMFMQGKSAFYTPRLTIHFARGGLLCCAIALWVFGLGQVPIAAATLVNFSIPLFVMVLSNIFLREIVGWKRWIAALVGFLGIVVTIAGPTGHLSANPHALWLVISALIFAGLDVMNKHIVVKGETILSMLFYSAVITTALCLLPLFFVWQTPTWQALLLFFILGIGANLILACLLKAFALADASLLAPLRYVEFLLAALFGYVFFAEIPGMSIYYGAAIVIPATLFIVYDEVVKHRKRRLAIHLD